MNHAHYLVTAGVPFRICDAWTAKKREALAIIDELAVKFHARRGRYMARGPRLEGLWMDGVFPTGWTLSKTTGYGLPNKKTKIGRYIAECLDKVVIPMTETLAVDLGCNPFFFDLDLKQQFCANIGIFSFSGDYYLEACRWCRPKGADGMVEIPASQYHKAHEDRLAKEIKS